MYNLYVSWGITVPLIKDHYGIADNDLLDLRNKKKKLLNTGVSGVAESMNLPDVPNNFFISRRVASSTRLMEFLEVIKVLPKPLRINFISFNDDDFLINLRKDYYQENVLNVKTNSLNVRNNPLYILLGIIPDFDSEPDGNIEKYSVDQKLAFEDFGLLFTKQPFEKINDYLKSTHIDI